MLTSYPSTPEILTKCLDADPGDITDLGKLRYQYTFIYLAPHCRPHHIFSGMPIGFARRTVCNQDRPMRAA